MTYKQWIEWHAEDIKWIVDMANVGIKVTPDAGNHPANVLLYGLQCDVKAALNSHIFQEGNE